MREHIHKLDNQAVLHQMSTPSRSKNDRHAFREYNHFTIDEIRRKLDRIIILTLGWVGYGERRHAELPRKHVPSRLYNYPW